jgi:DNA (cytosine-5)-methyltransferase 1
MGITKKGLQCSHLIPINNKYCFQHEKIRFKNNFASTKILSKDKKFNFIDLFAGCGGISDGFIKAGFKPLYLLDSDANCCETLKANHFHANIICDNLKMPCNHNQFFDKVDILIGGTPCQSFSEIGLRQGLLDERGKLLLTFID